MSEWRDMERRHALQQIRKMEQARSDSRQVADTLHRTIRNYQRKIHLYEWHLALGEESPNSRESMARAVGQLGGMIDFNRRSLDVELASERQAAENLVELRKQLARLDRWKRLAVRMEDWFWPVAILRAICIR